MKHPLNSSGELRLPKHICSDLNNILTEVELPDHLNAIRNLADFLASPNNHARSKLLLLDMLIDPKIKEIPRNATRPTEATAKLLKCLAFCTADYFQDTMEPIILWELRDVCAPKVQQQRDNKWRMDPLIETLGICLGGTKRPTTDGLEELYVLHDEFGVSNPLVLGGLFHLRHRDDERNNYSQEMCFGARPEGCNDAAKHVAVFLASLGVSEDMKTAALSFLLRNTEESRMAYQFCIDPQIDTSFFEERYFVLWELRAICLYQRQLQEIHHAKVMRAAGLAADAITSTAQGLHTILSDATELATTGMISASDLVVSVADNQNSRATVESDAKAAVVVRAYSGAAKRATDQVRTVAAGTSRQIRSVSAHHIRQAATKVPLPETQKTNLQAATHVAMACLGATATVGEAVFQSTGTLAKGATKAVSNVVQHKYGDTAGQVVRDIGDTVGNVLRTASHITLLTGTSSLPKSVAKETGRLHRFNCQTSKLEAEAASSVVVELGLKAAEISDTSMTVDDSLSTTSTSSSEPLINCAPSVTEDVNELLSPGTHEGNGFLSS